jgi:hypothetical protein
MRCNPPRSSLLRPRWLAHLISLSLSFTENCLQGVSEEPPTSHSSFCSVTTKAASLITALSFGKMPTT